LGFNLLLKNQMGTGKLSTGPAMGSHAIQGGVEILLCVKFLHAIEKGDKHKLHGPLGSNDYLCYSAD